MLSLTDQEGLMKWGSDDGEGGERRKILITAKNEKIDDIVTLYFPLISYLIILAIKSSKQ